MNTAKQEKIYVEIDEEITNVIDHLYQAKGSDIIFIVPQRALLLQSVVNLKLLAQEAKKQNKEITLMTRDEDGIAFAARAGVAVQPYITEEDDTMVYEENIVQQSVKEEDVPKYAKKIMTEEPMQRSQSGMGSQAFFAGAAMQGMNVSGVSQRQQGENISSTNYVVEREQKKHVPEKRTQQMDMAPILNNQSQNYNSNTNQSAENKHSQNMVMPHNQAVAQVKNENYQNSTQRQSISQQNTSYNNETSSLEEYEESLRGAQVSGVYGESPVQQNMQYHEQSVVSEPQKSVNKKTTKHKKSKKKQKNVTLSKTTNTALKGFIFGGIALVIIIIFIIILPKTKISVEPKEIDINESMDMTAKVDQAAYDAERRLIPARLIERDVTYTKSFDATGSGDVTAQKAQGTIMIFNEYSDAPQPLVATTRFLAEDGTLFRLVNQATVPGMSGDEPGKVEALVEADIDGTVGNIGPSRFSVPGFEGSPKKDKFYGISEKAMIGGGAGGTGVTIVTSDDIARAKEEMTKEMPQYIQDQILGLLRPENEVLVDDAITAEEIRSESNVSEGTMTDQFMYEIVSHVKTIVFSEDDVLAVMESNLTDKQQQYDAEQVDVEVSYDDVVADFDNQTMKMKADGTANVVATVDVESFKESILGKKHDEILGIMENEYGAEIEKITIESVVPGFPAFIANHISRFAFMTNMAVEQNE